MKKITVFKGGLCNMTTVLIWKYSCGWLKFTSKGPVCKLHFLE